MKSTATIESIIEKKALDKIHDFQEKGGGLIFHPFRVKGNIKKDNYQNHKPAKKAIKSPSYAAHLMVAKQTINKITTQLAEEAETSPTMKINHEELEKSGKKLSLEEFLGPFFNVDLNKPFVKETIDPADSHTASLFYPEDSIEFYSMNDREREVINSYHYYDSTTDTIKPDFPKRVREFQIKYPNENGNFAYAFLEPPYPLNAGKSMKERGEYLLDFMNYFFSDISEIEIYSWSTECSNFFSMGEEWYGAYFWTVYNPQKDWHLGICGSFQP